MSYQITKVDLIPNGDLSVSNVSQFDNGRVLPFEILENKEAYTFPNDIRVELHCRKPDGNIVTLPSENITNNIVTFLSTTQLTACYGKNICEIALYGPDDYLIGSGNFILDVEKSPTLGGINSTTAIHNLEEQIENITTEIIGENYYTKSETDTKLALKANAADVYTKSETDTKLALKANAADVYTKSETDTKLALKANAADVYTKSETDTKLALKANASDVYTKTEVDNIILDIMPVDTAFGPIATFNTKLAVPLVNVSCDIVATGGGGTPSSPVPIVGYSQANINANGNIINIAFGQTVYGGVLDVTRGKLTVTHAIADMGDLYWQYWTQDIFYASKEDKGFLSIDDLTCSILPASAYNMQTEGVFSVGGQGQTQNIYMRIFGYSHDQTGANQIRTDFTGQKIVYPLKTPFDIDLTPEVISAVVGANTVSSNIGPVTVRFKTTIEDYINGRINRSISNRLLLSSVNSDIIKEKSEIKEQSDIIEDIERGEKNE